MRTSFAREGGTSGSGIGCRGRYDPVMNTDEQSEEDPGCLLVLLFRFLFDESLPPLVQHSQDLLLVLFLNNGRRRL